MTLGSPGDEIVIFTNLLSGIDTPVVIRREQSPARGIMSGRTEEQQRLSKKMREGKREGDTNTNQEGPIKSNSNNHKTENKENK